VNQTSPIDYDGNGTRHLILTLIYSVLGRFTYPRTQVCEKVEQGAFFVALSPILPYRPKNVQLRKKLSCLI